jgi:predicted O-methyltransferase YrrM
MIKEWPDLRNSTSNEDCYFLKKMCEEYNPTKILEIGTFVGKSAYAMAAGSNCMIYTVDRNKDNFLKPDKYNYLAKRIIRHPLMDSMDFWKNYPELNGFDFVFVDGWLRQEDVENIFERTLDNFWFLCHDYRLNDKGEEVVKRMLMESMVRDYDFDISEGGECTALVKFGKA